MKAQAARAEPKALREKGSFPCIIHWEFNHFVVCDGFKGDKVYLNDPAKGSYAVSKERFDEGFTGIILMIEPGENFEPGGKPKSVLSFAKERLKGTGPAVAFVVLTTVIASVFNVVNHAVLYRAGPADPDPACRRVDRSNLFTPHRRENGRGGQFHLHVEDPETAHGVFLPADGRGY